MKKDGLVKSYFSGFSQRQFNELRGAVGPHHGFCETDKQTSMAGPYRPATTKNESWSLWHGTLASRGDFHIKMPGRAGMAVLAVYALFFLTGCLGGDPGKPLTILFHDVRMLAPGDNIYSAGVDIGDVKHITLQGKSAAVAVVIDSRFRDAMTEGVMFHIEKGGEGKRPYLVATLPDVAARPLADHAEVVGRESMAATAFRELDRFFAGLSGGEEAAKDRAAMDQLEKEMERFRGKVRDIPPELEKQMEQLSRFLEQGKQAGQQEMRGFFQALDRELAEVERLTREMTKSPEARELEQAIENYLKRFLPPDNKDQHE